ncbi:MAG: redoxin domain-containing protein [Planctomycetota bacterium]|nr:redoxin domain-containing protein [Planctomycetota bacterium]
MNSLRVIRTPSLGWTVLCVVALIGCGEKSNYSPSVTSQQGAKQSPDAEAPADATAKAPDATPSTTADRKPESANTSNTEPVLAKAEPASAKPNAPSTESDVEEQWSTFLATASNHYEFNPKQAARARTILDRTVSLASARRQRYAAKGGPAASADLKRDLSRLTDQFIDRVDSMASMEQIRTAAKNGFKSPRWRAPPDPAEVGFKAPGWSLRDPAGKTVSMADLKGKVVVLKFWGSWCGACRKALPGFQKLSEQYKDNADVEVIGVSCERNRGPKGALDLVKKQKYTFDVLLNGEQVAALYQVTGFPTLFVIGPDGKIVHKIRGVPPNVEKTLTPIIDRARKKSAV